MDNKKYAQCTNCGLKQEVYIKTREDDIYVNMTCPRCGNKRFLLCYDDYYKYYDVNLDERYYSY